jgi:hypothetical protein
VGWRNLPTLRVGWRNLFPVVLLCQFLVLAGNRFWLYILLYTWSTIQLWCCVSFFGSGGKYFLVLRTYLVYNTVVQLCQFFCCVGKVNFVQIPYSHDRFFCCTTISTTGLIYAKSSDFYAKLNVSNLNVMNLY